ncbi:MAG: hypothetical protein V3U32_02680 [Anaerolineales bacterium]
MTQAMMKSLPLALLLTVSSAAPAFAAQDPPPPYRGGESRIEPIDPSYLEAIQRTSAMVWDDHALRLAQMHGLDLINVTWEDTGRFYNSAVGPNISDMTIQVQHQDPNTGEYMLTLMPVIRYPNFVDLTADISPDDFYLLVGNEDGDDLERVTLAEYLDNFRKYLSHPGSWAGRSSSLLAPRDSHVLVSAQAAFLPVPQHGEATFNPVIFNYQSYAGDPAVLTIVASREGTSATVVDNMRDAFPAGWSWGQRLFFNQDGERASFTGERLSDFVVRTSPTDMISPTAAGESGLNMVLLIQVPLKQREPMRGMFFGEVMEEAAAAPSVFKADGDVEVAVIGHGKVEGPFTEIDGLAIERDPRFPIRVTVQFYKATSNGIVTEADMEAIASQIERVYDEADYVGSLVVDGASDRPTEYDGPKYEPPGWWESFWHRFEDNLQFSRWEALEVLRELGAVAWRWFEVLR